MKSISYRKTELLFKKVKSYLKANRKTKISSRDLSKIIKKELAGEKRVVRKYMEFLCDFDFMTTHFGVFKVKQGAK